MKIGVLAKMTNCQVETIRYYEREGLLPAPGRTEANYRFYTQLHFERLRFIRTCRMLDMTHEEIRQLLRYRDDPTRNCAGVNELVDEHIEHVRSRIASLQTLEAQLIELRRTCSEGREAAACKILQQLTRGEGVQGTEASFSVTRNKHHV
ncbi:Cd(II)/Pb(II)-responsive transcriptional regulator [Stutzerimonas nitrititolerans]|uniref:Cd(II)/Pb(II)-responsive transcriptional regulator n=1 Tax=Stutzerimonas nitrititolerans TaxID=2482751 RepID=UPI0035E3F181